METHQCSFLQVTDSQIHSVSAQPVWAGTKQRARTTLSSLCTGKPKQSISPKPIDHQQREQRTTDTQQEDLDAVPASSKFQGESLISRRASGRNGIITEAGVLFNLLVLFDLLVNLLVALFCWVRLRGVALGAAHLDLGP